MRLPFGLKMINVLVASALGMAVASGATIYSGPLTAINADDPTQLGRLSRDYIPSDWSAAKDFPGVFNPTTEYNFHVFPIVDKNYSYVQITMNVDSNDLFAAAYLNSFNPNNLESSYLGDEGGWSGFPGDPAVFQVVVPLGQTLDVVVNTTDPAGIGTPFQILVEGYTDTQFDDTITPEPSSAVLSGAGLLACGALLFMRRRNGRAGA